MEPRNADRMQWLIEHRHSTRVPFDPAQHVTDTELAHIVDAARWAPTAHNMQNFRLVVVDDRETLDALGRIRSRVSQRFIAENFRQLSWSPEELAERGTGLLGTMFPPSWWTGDPAAAPANVERALGETIAGAPMVIVAVYDPTQRAPDSDHDVLGMISLGCVLENMWLAAQACRLDAQVLSAFSGEQAEPEVARVLGIPAPWRIAYALRLGHAITLDDHERVRRQPHVFVHRNRFA